MLVCPYMYGMDAKDLKSMVFHFLLCNSFLCCTYAMQPTQSTCAITTGNHSVLMADLQYITVLDTQTPWQSTPLLQDIFEQLHTLNLTRKQAV